MMASSNLFWRIVVLTTAGTIGATARGNAAVFFSDDDGGYSRPAPAAPPRPQKQRRHSGKAAPQVREAAKPQGPLVVSISINQQNLRVYDANGFYAESPVSTGMAGHSTPMGVFSVIQKQKFHKSNIYSGAPMPFMQRITWSGIAMHAGVLPGYPASHGCIRMPMAFAVKMYNWTRMGARVIVTPGELKPTSFAHPLLVTQKVAPQPVVMDVPKADATAKGDKAANAAPVGQPATPEAKLELRSTVGHDSRQPAAMAELPTPVPLSEQTHTADAGNSSAAKAPVTMSDAAPAGSRIADGATQTSEPANTAIGTKSEAAESKSEPAENADTASSANTPVEDKPAGDKPSEQADRGAMQAVTPATRDTAKIDVAKTDVAKSDDTKTGDAAAATTTPKAGDATKTTVDATKDTDANKNQARPSDPDKAVAPKSALAVAKGSGPISVFISRKDSKLYVRQNFAPLFDVSVAIAPSDRPLGTHIFTAEADKTDANLLHWSVVTLPANRKAERRDDDERTARRRKIAGAAEIAKPIPEPDSPSEALDRLSIPADVMARITESLSTGGSIVVSDQGIAAGETGEGTDFIVSLR